MAGLQFADPEEHLSRASNTSDVPDQAILARRRELHASPQQPHQGSLTAATKGGTNDEMSSL